LKIFNTGFIPSKRLKLISSNSLPISYVFLLNLPFYKQNPGGRKTDAAKWWMMTEVPVTKSVEPFQFASAIITNRISSRKYINTFELI
jgi:hypothetical protein